MRIALLGTGKTGSMVSELCSNITHFNSKNIPTSEKLKGHDVILSFLPADAFISYLSLLMETKLPVVSGSTGFEWPAPILEELKEKKLKWVHGTNFSLGIALFKTFIHNINQAKNLFPNTVFEINETHHTQKIDAPSGTAISLSQWLDSPCEISSIREGDEIGYHELIMQADSETLAISHKAKDRAVFAKGALWACETIITDKKMNYGLIQFNDLVNEYLQL